MDEDEYWNLLMLAAITPIFPVDEAWLSWWDEALIKKRITYFAPRELEKRVSLCFSLSPRNTILVAYENYNSPCLSWENACCGKEEFRWVLLKVNRERRKRKRRFEDA
jgi:hypothetical protein